MERLEWDCDDPLEWEVHRYRYAWAARFVGPADRVLDCACGTGYGKMLLPGDWTGVEHPDREAGFLSSTGVVFADLETWTGPAEPFDVFVGLETIEHLVNGENYLAVARQALSTVVLSTPIVPTVHMNEFHLRDWTAGEIEDAFPRSEWRLVDTEVQRGTYGLWAWTRE